MVNKTHIQKELSLISPAVADLSNTTPLTVPEGYFDQLTARILKNVLQKTENEEIEADLSPLLQSLRHQNPYSIPTEYFRNFEVDLPAESTKLITMYSWKKWVGYAAAACIAGLIIAFMFGGSHRNAVEDLALDKITIENQTLSTESIQTYLHEADQFTDGGFPGTDFTSGSDLLVDMTPQVISEMLKEIPENDISSFIKQTEGNEMVILN